MTYLKLSLLSLSLAALMFGCSKSDTNDDPLVPEIESITIEGTNNIHAIAIGSDALQLIGRVIYTDGTNSTTYVELDWDSNDTTVISVHNGLLEARSNQGTASITAKYRDKIFSNTHTVSIVPLTDVNITSSDLTIDYTADNNDTNASTNSTYQLAVNGIFSDMNETLDISSNAVWTSSNITIASVGSTGSISTLDEGNTTIQVSLFNEINSSIELNVTTP